MSKMVYIRTDKNGTEIYHDYTCQRCGGAGGSDKWTFTGWTCYECGGSGESVKPYVYKKYTPDYRAKLDERAKVRAEKKRLERVEKFKANLSEYIQAKGFNENNLLYVVTGDTYSIKDQLKEAGAKWNTYFYSWVFTEKTDQYTTVEVTAEECLDFNYDAGWIEWKDINYKELIQSKLPKENKPVSDYVGQVGDKLELEVTFYKQFTYKRRSFSGYGTDLVSIYKFLDDQGNSLVWNTTAYIEVTEGEKYLIKGTVSEHSEYKGEKQTTLKRCKVKNI